MAISNKLNYLIETKQLFKDRLNSLGAEIIESTTFRNYLNWLDIFYNQSSDKTDLAKNGVVGRTSQESTTGKNLFKVSNGTFTKNGVTATINDSIITLNGTATANVYLVITSTEDRYSHTFSGNYTISKITSATTIGSALYGTDSGGTDRAFLTINNNASAKTQAINETYTNIRTQLNIENGATFNNTIVKLQLEQGSTATSFEPFTNGPSPNPDYPQPINNLSGNIEYRVRGQGISESFPLSLGDIELCDISDYKDRIYSQNGKFYLEKKTGKVVLDGSESGWAYDSVFKYFRCPSYSFTELPLEMTSANRASYIQYSNNFTLNKSWSGTGSFRDTTDVSMFYPAQNSGYKIILRNVNFTTTSDFSNWLSSNNTLIYYPLATPTTTEITQENYPTLYSQLLAIQEFLTKYKINNEFLLDYSSPEIEY